MLDLKNIVAPFLAALWQGRKVILTIAWLICIAGWVAVALLPNVYTAKARMFVDTDTLLKPLMKDLAVTPDFDRQVAIMRDTLFALPNIERLMKRTGIGRDVRDSVERAGVIEDLQKDLYLTVLRGNLFEIGFKDGDPEVAYDVVSAMLEIFVQQQLGHSQRDVEIAGAFIDEQISAYDEKLRAAELRLAEFQREHAEELGGAERSVRDLERNEAESRRLRSEIEAAHWRRDQLRAQLDSTPRTISSAQAGGSDPSPAQQQLRDLNQELTRKLLLYTDQHPDIVALRQLIDQANQQVKAEGDGTRITDITVPNPQFQQVKTQLDATEALIGDLERRLKIGENESQALSYKIREAPEVEADLKRLNRDYDVLLSQYEQLTRRRESAQLARELDEGKKRIEFRTVEPPVVPLTPSGPPHGLLMIAVLVLGIGAGCAYVLGRFVISDTVLTSAQLQKAFPALPVLGGVSEIKAGSHGPLAEHAALLSGTAALLAVFATFFYLYQLSPTKPDLVRFTSMLTESVAAEHAKAEP